MFVYDSLDDVGGSNHAIRLLTIWRSHDEDAPVECKLAAREIFQTKGLDAYSEPEDCVHHEFGLTKMPANKFAYPCKDMEQVPTTKNANDCILCNRPEHVKDDVPSYEALSYVWGGTLDQTAITINDKAFSVTKRLETALKDLRQPDNDRVIWVDAICIDQKNTAEKSRQVLLMALIYENAAGVVAWLDPGCEIGHLAIKTIEELGGSQDVLIEDPRYKLQRVQITGPRMVPKVMPDAPSLRAIVAEDGGRWKALVWFLTHRWWKRIWILQEAQHAKELRFQVGRKSCLLDSLVNILHSDDMRETHYTTVRQYENFKYLNTLQFGRVMLHHPLRELGFRQSASLTTLLSKYDYCESTDPRDMIYALLNLADIDRLGLIPDYGKSVCNVYHDATRSMIQTDDSLDILRSVHRSMIPSALRSIGPIVIDSDERRTSPLASWAPDFSQRIELKHQVRSAWQGREFKASGDSKPVCRFGLDYGTDVVYSTPEYVMNVMGRSFDVLDWSPDCIPQSAFGDDSWLHIVRSWIRRRNSEPQTTSTDESASPTCLEDLVPTSLKFNGFEGIASTKDTRERDYPGGGTYEDAIFSTLMDRPIKDEAAKETEAEYDRLMCDFCDWMEEGCTPPEKSRVNATITTQTSIDRAPGEHVAGSPQRETALSNNATDNQSGSSTGQGPAVTSSWRQKRAEYQAEHQAETYQESFVRRGTALPFPFLGFLWFFLPGRKLAYTKSGRVALVPFDAQEGDILAVLKGLDVPVVLRNYPCDGIPPDRERKKKMFVGTAYVHGVMQGDKVILALLKSSAEWFTLV